MSQARLYAMLVAAAFGIVLVGLAIPRFVGGLVVSPFDETLRALGRGETVSDGDLRIAARSRETALKWYDNARWEADLGALNYTLARRLPLGSAERAELVAAAIERDRRAVARTPSAAIPWLRLAQAQVERDGLAADVAPYLRMSYRTAPYDPRMVMPRLQLAMTVWNDLPDDLRETANAQIRLAMDWFPRELVQVTRSRRRLAEVRSALGAGTEARARFNLLYFLRRDIS